MDNPVFISAQEAAERLLTIKIGGIIIFSAIVLGGIWFLLVWKYGEDRRKTEAENAKARIMVTKTVGTSVARAIEKDGGWKEQYYILKKKYDVLEAHCKNLERTLASVEVGKFVTKEASNDCD